MAAATVSVLDTQMYQDYQVYVPSPYAETLQYDSKQNDGWQ